VKSITDGRIASNLSLQQNVKPGTNLQNIKSVCWMRLWKKVLCSGADTGGVQGMHPPTRP